MYFNIQRFSTHDGDGIRTILFLKGCSLACSWCQNPESRSEKRSLLFDERSCLKECQLCEQTCAAIQRVNGKIKINRAEINEEDLIALETICPTQGLSVVGKESQVDALFEQLIKDKAFFEQSGGGVTFSGGEPLLQSAIVVELAKRLKSVGVSTAIETCMHVPWKNIQAVAPYIDCWLADLKHTDDTKFLKWAKGSISRIKDNFQRIAPIAKRIVIRVPVVPDFNDSEQELYSIIDFAGSLKNCKELHLLPYHTLGINKYNLLDMPYKCSETPLNKNELLNKAKNYAEKHTPLNVTIRG